MRGRQCRICRNKNEVAEGEELLPVGCKCFAAVHLSCAIRAAQASEDMWMLCPKCQCRWGGDLDQGLFEAAPHPPEHEMQTCRVCLKQATSDDELLSCGCACRSHAATFSRAQVTRTSPDCQIETPSSQDRVNGPDIA